MATERVADMTVEELQLMIDRAVERKMIEAKTPTPKYPLNQVIESVTKHRWTPPPGSKSTLELLRADRDR